MRAVFLFVCMLFLAFIVFESLNENSSIKTEDVAFLSERSIEAEKVSLECLSPQDPEAICICYTDDGRCYKVRPGVQCLNGTQPFCP